MISMLMVTQYMLMKWYASRPFISLQHFPLPSSLIHPGHNNSEEAENKNVSLISAPQFVRPLCPVASSFIPSASLILCSLDCCMISCGQFPRTVAFKTLRRSHTKEQKPVKRSFIVSVSNEDERQWMILNGSYPR